MSGCRIVVVPSSARASLHASSECASATCQWQSAGGLVVPVAEVDAQRHLLHRRGEREVRGRVVDGIAADDDERLDLPLRHLADEAGERGRLSVGARRQRLGVGHGLPGVAERVVHRGGERVDRRGLRVAGDDEAAAAVRRRGPPPRPRRTGLMTEDAARRRPRPRPAARTPRSPRASSGGGGPPSRRSATACSRRRRGGSSSTGRGGATRSRAPRAAAPGARRGSRTRARG